MLERPELSFVKMAEGTSSTNDVKQLIGINQDLAGRSVSDYRGYRRHRTQSKVHHIFKQADVKQLKWLSLSLKPTKISR
jgi:hypoxanthine phosphoribosyltransferase